MTSPQLTSPMLRIVRGGATEKSVPLIAGKCTIGSSPRCQVLLPASDARPMHCLVALEAGSATATRWAPGVLLNGKEFAVAPFNPGDRLTIGPWEIALELAPIEVTPIILEAQAAQAPCEWTPLAPAEARTFEAQLAATAAEETQPVPCRALVVVEPSVRPRPASPLRLPAAESTQLRQVEEALAELIAEASASAPPQRSGAKTQLLASRKTAPVVVPPARPRATASQTYADRLLVRLWTANHQARSRFALLLDATRRILADAASAAASEAAARDELARSRAAHDADLASWNAEAAALQEELTDSLAQQQSLKRDLESALSAAESAAAAQEELAASCAAHDSDLDRLNAEVVALQQELDDRVSQHQRLQDELAASAQMAAAAAEANARLADLAREHASAEETLAALRQQLEEHEASFAQAAREHADAIEGRQRLESQLAVAQQRTEELQAEVERLIHEHAEALQAAYAERDELREALIALEAAITSQSQQLEYEPAVQATPQAWSEQPEAELEAPAPDAWEPPVEGAEAGEDAAIGDMPAESTESAEPTPEGDEWFSRWRSAASDDAQSESLYDDAAANDYAADDQPAEPAIDSEQPAAEAEELVGVAMTYGDDHFAPAPIEESPEADFEPTSYIDRYRDLLGDDAEPSQDSSPARAILDEEYLSPAQARKGDDPHDDSDEALEAYMSNLMRRVRSGAASGASPGMADRSAAITPGLLSSTAVAEVPTEPETPSEPLDLEGLRASRREARPVDLAALREIANDSTRLAMAEHMERQHVDSMMNRGILFGLAASASAYSLYTAPDVGSIWFWAGAAAAFAAGGLGIQLAMLLRRRIAMQSRRLDPLAAITPAIDFSALEMPMPAPAPQH